MDSARAYTHASGGCGSSSCGRRVRAARALPAAGPVGWWENQIQIEALAALAAWVERYDSGEWDDPPGKLALLYDLEHISTLLSDGSEPFHPQRDRAAFTRHIAELDRQPAPRALGEIGGRPR